jgi:type I restriction enzyme M protein
MARTSRKTVTKTLEQRLWDTADALRGNQEPSEYKHVVLGLVFLKYISDRFDERRNAIQASLSDPGSLDYIPNEARRTAFLEDRDEYTSHSVFWVPADARWEAIQARAKLPSIGQDLDRAMDLIEKENRSIRGVLPRNYGREGLDKGRLGQLVDLIGSIGFTESDDHGSDDVLGRVYEYFLGRFAGKETGMDAGAFYTPRSVVRTLVEMLEPYQGRVFDPACGSGGMFVQSAEFVKAHGGKRTDISIYGQEFTDTTWKLAKMNLALRGIEADLGDHSADSFANDLHPDLRADFVIANPPFNVSNWWHLKLAHDPRWKYGTPPPGNANFAWVQHFTYHLSPKGTAGFVLANGSLSSRASGESDVRERLVKEDLVDCVVTLPDRLFFNTAIPVSLWFISKGRHGNGHRARAGEVLFIDARQLGHLETRRLRVLSDDDIARIADTYHSWRSKNPVVPYADVEGFAGVARVEEIAAQGYVLAPSRYVGSSDDAADPNDPAVIYERSRLVGEARKLLADFDAARDAASDALRDLSQALEVDEWQEVRVGSVAKVIGGGTPPSRDDSNFGGSIPWITPKDMTGHQGRYIAQGARSLSEAGLANSSAKLLPKNAVLVSSRAPIGLVAIAAQSVTTNQGVRSLVFDETQDPVFWYYLLRQSTSALDAHANGSTFREISGGSLAKLTFTVPSLAWQRRIAATLDRMDGVIEHNLALNEVLGKLSVLGSHYAVRRSE